MSVVKTLRVMKVPKTLADVNFIDSTGLTVTSTDALIFKNASILFYCSRMLGDIRLFPRVT